MTAASSKSTPRIVLSADGSDDVAASEAGYKVSSAVLPLMLGITAPALLVMLIDPNIVVRQPFLVSVVLIPLLVVALAIFAYCVLFAGEISALIADREKKTLEVVETNLFASRTTPLSFRDIVSIGQRTRYDEDGYANSSSELVLKSGRRIPLPAWLEEQEVATLQRTLGLQR